MIIKDSTNQKWIKLKARNSVSAVKWVFTLVLLVVMVIAGVLASRSLKTKGYTGLWDFLTTLSKNYWDSKHATPEMVSIEIKDKDIKLLEKNREQALERGVIINELDGKYVSGTLQYKGHKLKVKLRLKGHMTDHLQNDKWSFRIKVSDKNSFLGMKRFSFQHPGTRGYIYEWIYHQLMKREGIIALRYCFIQLTVNGKDWGIYAVEENFEDELIANNQRPKGPILRFNPDLYWVDRYNELKGTKPTSEFASYYSANVEAYRENKILKDTVQFASFIKGLKLMEGLRNMKIPVDEAMDVPRLARFHAIIDLVGGQQSMDWSDVKYYYNPISNRLEPIAYESFTHFPSTEISGMYKYIRIDSSENYEDWHQLLFSNATFFRAYVKELERISQPSYLDHFFKEVNEELKQNLSILHKEFPYKKFDEKDYYKNQVMIRQMLNAPKSFHAYLKGNNGNRLELQLGSIESLPVEIHAVQAGKSRWLPQQPFILACKQHNMPVRYQTVTFEGPENYPWNDSLKADLKVTYSLLGASEIKEENVFPFPYPDPGQIVREKPEQWKYGKNDHH
jgi:hypothetical protein